MDKQRKPSFETSSDGITTMEDALACIKKLEAELDKERQRDKDDQARAQNMAADMIEKVRNEYKQQLDAANERDRKASIIIEGLEARLASKEIIAIVNPPKTSVPANRNGLELVVNPPNDMIVKSVRMDKKGKVNSFDLVKKKKKEDDDDDYESWPDQMGCP